MLWRCEQQVNVRPTSFIPHTMPRQALHQVQAEAVAVSGALFAVSSVMEPAVWERDDEDDFSSDDDYLEDWMMVDGEGGFAELLHLAALDWACYAA